ncbi:MAG: peptidylprolyl isomerase [Clostridiales bacterium]|nr:peptidylprolyl isomerase [Clostridiales bacterium]
MEKNLIAKVGEREIYLEDIQGVRRFMSQEQLQMLETPNGQKDLLDWMILQEMMYQNAIEEKLDQEEEFVRIMDDVKIERLKEYYIQKILDSVEVKEDDIKAYFDENKGAFEAYEAIRARHILVDSEEKANEILDEIKSGKSFEEAAFEYSKCPSKDNGGDLGFFERGSMVLEFEKAAFDLEEGEMSGAVKTQFGYHIIKLEERRNQEMSYEEMKNQIRQFLIQKERSSVFNQLAMKLKEKYSVDVNDALIDHI